MTKKQALSCLASLVRLIWPGPAALAVPKRSCEVVRLPNQNIRSLAVANPLGALRSPEGDSNWREFKKGLGINKSLNEQMRID